MYNEQNNFSMKNVILQFLFAALFIFILIWLFPLKSDLKNAINGIGSTDLSVLTDRIFNENIISMKESAKSYYTNARLPKKIGDKEKMTLAEMLNKKIILPFTDKNGDTCDLTESYVEITKYDEEFIMKVNLKCGSDENYLLVYMGCYDYCTTAICEKNASDVSSPIIYSNNKPSNPGNIIINNNNNVIINNENNNTNNNNNNNNGGGTTDPDPITPPDEKQDYIYEYKLETKGTYKETDWSAWDTKEVSASSTMAVRIKTVTEKKLTGYNVKKQTDYNKPIYGNKQIQTGYEEKKVCKRFDYVPTGEYTTTYGNWQYAETVYLSYFPSNTSTVQYIKVDESTSVCTGNCSSQTTTAYKKYVRAASGKTPVTEYKCVEEGVEKTPTYTTIQVITGYETKIISKEPVYKEVVTKYYSYKTRTYIPGKSDIKWSVFNDTTLLNAGYKYTSNMKPIK